MPISAPLGRVSHRCSLAKRICRTDASCKITIRSERAEAAGILAFGDSGAKCPSLHRWAESATGVHWQSASAARTHLVKSRSDRNVRRQPEFLRSVIPVPNAHLCTAGPSQPQVFTGKAHLPHGRIL